MLKRLVKRIFGGAGITGSYIIRVHDSVTKELLYESDRIKNRIVSSNGYGRNLIIRQLAGDTTYPIEIDSAKIGTGTATPTDADTDIQTVAVSGLTIADATVTNNQVIFGIFIPTGTLPNGTYTEFTLHANGRLFARSLFSPSFTKGTNQDTTIEYTIQLT